VREDRRGLGAAGSSRNIAAGELDPLAISGARNLVLAMIDVLSRGELGRRDTHDPPATSARRSISVATAVMLTPSGV